MPAGEFDVSRELPERGGIKRMGIVAQAMAPDLFARLDVQPGEVDDEAQPAQEG